MSGTYSWRCDRCDTSATDSSRAGVELFAAHHVKTMHAWLVRLDGQQRQDEVRRPRRRLTSMPERGPRLCLSYIADSRIPRCPVT